MIAVIIPMKIHYIAHNELVHKTVSGVQITDAFQPLGIVTATMVRKNSWLQNEESQLFQLFVSFEFFHAQIVATRLMNRRNIVNPKVERALVICSHATMAIAYHEFTFVMVTMV